MTTRWQKGRDRLRTAALAARLLLGRRFWAWPLVVLLWPAFQTFRLLVGWRQEDFRPESAQGTLIGFPMAFLAIFLGVRIIAGEIDARRLEIAYTVPGGAQRVWMAKLLAALGTLLFSEALLAVTSFAFFTPFPPGALYGALQVAAVYLVLAMGLSTLFRSEVTGAMGSVGILFVNSITGVENATLRLSPFFNPLSLDDTDPEQVFAYTLQNRVGFALLVVALAALAFTRAERREKMLAG